MSPLLKGLNPSQKKAVLHDRGPLLVLAGAGSGKTRVLTVRIARLVKDGLCRPGNVLAVTFTNKAAREMRERMAKLVSTSAAKAMTISTFHSFGARVLREKGEKLGLKKNFSILDEHERMSALKNVMRSGGASMCKEQHSDFATQISLFKNASLDPDDTQVEEEGGLKKRRIYKAYQTFMLKRQTVDFDDLLLMPLRLFERHPDVLTHYQRAYTYVCIDEYQDTNAVQMKLALKLAAPQNNLMVVGDDDQSIYSWRGADTRNILSFDSGFKGCKTVVLDRNYRSTAAILDGAMAVVAKNRKRKLKNVVAAAGEGEPIDHYRGDDETDEAFWVARTIVDNVKENRFRYRDHALLFRTNAMMRRFEEELRHARVPYRVVGAMSFFERKEIKDILAYMRFFANTADELSLTRVLKVPDRGITKPTLEELDAFAGRRRMGLYEALERADEVREIKDGQKEKCRAFVQWHRAHAQPLKRGTLAKTLEETLSSVDYFEHLRRAYKEDNKAEDRLENVREIIHGLAVYEHKRRDATLSGYLQEVALTVTDDKDDGKDDKRGVSLMTIHKAKGLEFPVVFMAGLDDSYFPSPRTIAEGNVEEERRLFYVAMTRAQRRLILTYPRTKLFRNKDVQVTPTRFIFEIPEEYLERPLGQQEDEQYQEYVSDFFQQMRDTFARKQEPGAD